MIAIGAIGVILGGCLTIYIGYILITTWYYNRIPCPKNTGDLPYVSVIIPARNEAIHLAACLQGVLTQMYPPDRYEVILVDDASEDQTYAIAQNFAHRYDHLCVLRSEPTPNTVAYKKAALDKGIRHAKGEIILQTDADCLLPPTWIETMARHFDHTCAMVSGPVRLIHNNSLFERLQSLEYIGLGALGAGAIAMGKPNMCNGANMGFRKELFIQVGGYDRIDHLASGDDELLMQKFTQLKEYTIRFAKCRSAIVDTWAISSWNGFIQQRLRWVSKARHYTRRSINILQSLSYLGFWTFPFFTVYGLYDITGLWALLVFFVMKFSADLVLMYHAAAFYDRKYLLIYLVALQLAYIPYVIWIGIAGNTVDHYQWKNRTLR